MEDRLRQEFSVEKHNIVEQHALQLEHLRDRISIERQKAAEEEREHGRLRYQKQLEREEMEYQTQKRALIIQSQEEKRAVQDLHQEDARKTKIEHEREVEKLKAYNEQMSKKYHKEINQVNEACQLKVFVQI